MHVSPHFGRLVPVAILAMALASAAAPARAQSVTPPSTPMTSAAVQPTATIPPQESAIAPPGRQPPSPQALGGLNCLMFGTIGAASVYVYNDILMVAISGYVNPALLIPTMTAGFIAGCGIGNTLTPGLIYLQNLLF